MFKKALFLLLISTLVVQAQHTITGTFIPKEDYKWAILYKMSPTRPHYISQGKINDGKIAFTLDSTQTKGIYKIVYDIPQEEFNFDLIYDGKEDITFTFDKSKGVTFTQSSQNNLLDEYITSMTEVGKDIGAFYVNNLADKNQLITLFNKQRELQEAFENQAKGKLVYEFIKASKPYIPEDYVDATTYITDLQKHYFDTIDYTNPVLQSSSFLMERTLGYMIGFVPDENDILQAYANNLDEIYTHLQKAPLNFQKSFMSDLWQKLVNYKLTETANYLAEKYLIPVATQLGDTELVENLTQFKNLSIGNVAPDFSWETTQNGQTKTQNLHSLDVAQNYILVFWSSTCSHCLKQIPQLQKFVKTLDSTKYKVIAIGLEDEDNTNWNSEIYYYPEFIHVYGPGKWKNPIGKKYGVTGTPTYFVLDKDKKFIAKPQNFEELKAFITGKKEAVK
jgi:thiol-disulfide isomerase/thioredoxin